MTRRPDVSIVVPTYNRCDRLSRMLDALDAQRLDDVTMEVIVVSDGSTDGTVDMLRRRHADGSVTCLDQPNAGPAAARNAGVHRSTADVVLFLDDDVVPAPDLVRLHVQAHRDATHPTVVIGPMLDPADHDMSPWVRWEQRMLAKQYSAMLAGVYGATARQFYTGNASVPRAALLDAGLFDTELRRMEDIDLAYRLADHGVHFVFEPRAVGWHYAERSFEAWHAIAHAYGRTDVQFLRDQARGDVRSLVVDGYRSRHAVLRGLVRVSLSSARADRVLDRTLRGSFSIVRRAHVRALEGPLLSCIYNVAYYRGMADTLGGRAALRALISGGTT